MQIDTQTKVGKLVSQNYRTAQVFTHFGIDFCCKGGISIEEACKNKSVEVNALVTELEKAMRQPVNDLNWDKNNLSALIDHILDKHHRYINETGPTLLAYLNKISQVHGERHPELIPIYQLFHASLQELAMHMKKEELILFPLIRKQDKDPANEALRQQIEAPIRQMEAEHSQEGDRFDRIRQLSAHYAAPADACQTYRVAFQLLSDFEADLHRHIHLENNILFPTALSRA
jgi:regulator of cell morphogenesis and NO signaling